MRDLDAHARMDTFLCKTLFCQRLVRRYVHERKLKARVLYMGHTSLDPRVPAASASAAGAGREDGSGGGSDAALPAMDFRRFLHVRGGHRRRRWLPRIGCHSAAAGMDALPPACTAHPEAMAML